MSEILLFVRVTVNDAQVEKMNRKRVRLGRQVRSGVDEAINLVGEALQHNLIFIQPVVTQHNFMDETVQALKNSGVDTECGACMEIAFTGVTTTEHTCSSPAQTLQDELTITG